MDPAALQPAAQLFVCTNVRASGDPLASGCGEHGPAVYAALKRTVATAARTHDVWVTRTACLGHCPPRGCSVVVHPGNAQYINVTVADVPQLARRAMEPGR
jgi:predicted metal-binding protein